MEKLKKGLELFLNFYRETEKAQSEGKEPLFQASQAGWELLRENKQPGYKGVAISLRGHGMEFIFENVPRAEQLAPPIERLASWWAQEKIVGKNKLDDTFLANSLCHTYNPKAWPARFAMESLAKIITFLETGGNDLPEDDRRVFHQGLKALQEMKNPGERFWKLLTERPGMPISKQEEIIRKKDPTVSQILYNEAIIDCKGLVNRIKSEERPVVYFQGLPEQDILAQMCVYGYRQTKNEDCIRYLLNYTKSILGKQSHETVYYVCQHWKTSPSGGSLKQYIIKVSKHQAEKQLEIPVQEIDRQAKDIALQFPLTVEQAALLLTQGPYSDNIRNVVRWLYNQLNAGKVPNAGFSAEKVTPGGVLIKRNQYLIKREGFEKAKTLWEIKNIRPYLVKQLVNKKGITPRAARKWIRERLKSGKTLNEIVQEIKKKAPLD